MPPADEWNSWKQWGASDQETVDNQESVRETVGSGLAADAVLGLIETAVSLLERVLNVLLNPVHINTFLLGYVSTADATGITDPSLLDEDEEMVGVEWRLTSLADIGPSTASP